MIKRHTPSLETVWAEWERKKRLEKWRAAHPQRPDRPRIPDNSEPWLKHPPRAISDLFYVSDCVAEVAKKWGPQATSSLKP
jgi:hypothetical protein